MKNLPNKDLFTPDEAVTYFSVTRRTIYAWCEQGKLERKDITKRIIRISRKSIVILAETDLPQ